MTRHQFLNLTIHPLPYCAFKDEYRPYRTSSNKFYETLHQKGRHGILMNIHWSCDEDVSVGLHNLNEKNPWKQKTRVWFGKDFSQEILNDLVIKYLIHKIN